MKKTFIIVFTFILGLLSLVNSVKANNDNWIKNDDGYYYYDISNLTVGSSLTISVLENEILQIKDFDKEVFSEFERNGQKAKTLVLEILKSGDWYEARHTFKTLNGEILGTYKGSSYLELSYLKDDIKIRKLVNIVDIPNEEFTSIYNLPATVENPDIHTMLGHVEFTIQNKTVLVTLTYFGTYRFKLNVSSDTDMSIFNSLEAYYLNFNDTPQIIINNGDKPYLKDILLDTVGDESPAFIKHTIWDLKTNELSHVDKYNAYTYIKQNTQGAVISYFYVDDFVIENILKAKISYTTRTRYKFPFSIWNGEYTAWETENLELENNDFLSYKNKTRNWKDYVPVWNTIRWVNRQFVTREMPRIDQVDFNNTQKYYNVSLAELNRQYNRLDPNFNGIKDHNNYNVYAFALYENISNEIEEIQFYNTNENGDPNNFQIIEMMYETKGKIYTTVGSDMNNNIGTDNNVPTVDNESDFNLANVILIAVAFIGYFIVLNGNKGFRNFDSFIKITILYGLIVILGYFLLNKYLFTKVILRL